MPAFRHAAGHSTGLIDLLAAHGTPAPAGLPASLDRYGRFPIGDGIFIVALAWEAYSISDRPSALAYVGLATSAPQIVFLLLGGAVSDRFSRRRLLFWADVARGLAVASLALLLAFGGGHLWQLCAVGAVIGTATAFASPAFDALVPELVPEHELTQANAIDQFVRPTAIQLAGPALGGVAVAVLRPWGAFAADAATFAFSAMCVGKRRLPVGQGLLGGQGLPGRAGHEHSLS